jgi:hypothetical protein
MKGKFILDVCCGGRMFWFNKKHPNTLYLDIRKEEKGFIKARKNHEVNPDIIMDFRKLDFPDKSFKLIIFDPPHIMRIGNKSWMAQKYGMLGKDWKNDLKKGFEECWRVLEDHGCLIFKWSEAEISFKEVLSLFPKRPLFGHPTARSGKTKWFCFMKIPKEIK